ncbi:M24 family metallopeptidase [Chloroflexota bacterium]
MPIKQRLEILQGKLAEKKIDAILVSQPENRYYLTGFDGSAGFLLVTSGKKLLATDCRYTEQAACQAPDCEVFRTSGDLAEWFPEMLSGLNLRKLGFESAHLTFSTHQRMSDIIKKARPELELVPLEGAVESLRAVKEPEEIELITRAVKISDTAMNTISESIEVGITEEGIACQIERSLRENGSRGLAFDIIVASGANAALPHHKPSSRAIQSGEPVVIDIGAKVEGYCSDITRTIYIGKNDDKFNKVYDAVLRAQLVASTSARAGMTGGEIDALGRKMIEEEGFGEYFGHGLGHGIGLATHEQPRLGPKSQDVIADGMIFSIEPGIYLTGWGGVRIEDLCIMENGKIRVITKARKM